MALILRIRKILRLDKVEITMNEEFENNLALFINEIPEYHSDIQYGCFGPTAVDHFPHYPVFGHY